MKRTVWIAVAFVAGAIFSVAASRAKAEADPLPMWVIPGACTLVASSGGAETVVQVQQGWVKVKPARTTVGGTEAPELWRNLAVAQWIERRPEEACRRTAQ